MFSFVLLEWYRTWLFWVKRRLCEMLGAWLLGNSPIWSQLDSDLIFVSRSSKSLFWVPCTPTPRPPPRKVDGYLGRATLLVASLFLQLPFCLVVFVWTPGHFKLAGLTQGEHPLIQSAYMSWFPVEVRREYCSFFKSYDMVGAHIFLSLIFHIYWAFTPYPMFFGEHLEGGSSVHVKAQQRRRGAALWSEGTG